jgi:hypothetical protein
MYSGKGKLPRDHWRKAIGKGSLTVIETNLVPRPAGPEANLQYGVGTPATTILSDTSHVWPSIRDMSSMVQVWASRAQACDAGIQNSIPRWYLKQHKADILFLELLTQRILTDMYECLKQLCRVYDHSNTT